VISPEGHRFVFVGGLHRSGTSLLARWLAEHPAISGFSGTGAYEDEGQHLQTVYPVEQAHGGVGRFGFAPDSHLTEDSPLVTEANRRRLMSEWGRYWDLDKPVLIEKSPPNLTKMRFFQAMFPSSHFIVVMRHPAAVATATQKWSRKIARWFRPHRLVRHWVRCHEIVAVDAPRLDRLTVVRYEDLMSDPDAEIRRLFRFLDLEPPPLEHPVTTGLNEEYLERWRGNGRNPFKYLYTRGIAARYERSVNRFGYSFREPLPLVGVDELRASLVWGEPAPRAPAG